MHTLTFAICDSNPEQMRTLRELCIGIAIRTDIEMQLLQFSGEQMKQNLLRYCDTVNLALISLDMEHGLELGCSLSRRNPDCYLLFYTKEPCAMEPLLWARPIAFYSGPLTQEPMERRIVSICDELFKHTGMLQYKTKNFTGMLPYRRIACAESDRKHVNIHLENGDILQLYQKLDALEQAVAGGTFFRVHQSWLVNLNQVIRLDRTQHLLYLQNGESVPVSKSYYEKVARKLESCFADKSAATT